MRLWAKKKKNLENFEIASLDSGLFHPGWNNETIILWMNESLGGDNKKKNTEVSPREMLPSPTGEGEHVAWTTGLTKLPLGFLGCARHLYLGHFKEFFDLPLIQSAHVVDISLENQRVGWKLNGDVLNDQIHLKRKVVASFKLFHNGPDPGQAFVHLPLGVL